MLPIPITNTNDNHLFEAEWGVGPTSLLRLIIYSFGISLERRKAKSGSTPAQRRQERRSDPISTRRFFAKRAKRARNIHTAAKKKGREIVRRTLQFLPESRRVSTTRLVSTSANPRFAFRSNHFVGDRRNAGRASRSARRPRSARFAQSGKEARLPFTRAHVGKARKAWMARGARALFRAPEAHGEVGEDVLFEDGVEVE